MPDTETELETEAKDLIQVYGVVRMVGNMPFPELVITDSERDWYIDADEVYRLKDYQHRRLVVEGVLDIIPIVFASGILGGERHILREIRIISVE